MPVDTRRQGRLKKELFTPRVVLGAQDLDRLRTKPGTSAGQWKRVRFASQNFRGANFAKRFGLALAKPRGPPVRVLLPCCCRRFPCKGYKNSRFQRLGNLELGCGNVRLILAGGRQREQAFNRIPSKISYSRELGAETGSRLTASSATAERTYQPERRVRRCAPQNPLGFLLYLWPGDSASGSMRREQ
jgi:hypothetical protein